MSKGPVQCSMTEEQRAAHLQVVKESNARVDAIIKPAMDLYHERCWLWHLSCKLELRDLQRLNGILRQLSDDDLRRVAAYAEGLAEWSSPASQSPDGEKSTG